MTSSIDTELDDLAGGPAGGVLDGEGAGRGDVDGQVGPAGAGG